MFLKRSHVLSVVIHDLPDKVTCHLHDLPLITTLLPTGNAKPIGMSSRPPTSCSVAWLSVFGTNQTIIKMVFGLFFMISSTHEVPPNSFCQEVSARGLKGSLQKFPGGLEKCRFFGMFSEEGGLRDVF